MVVFGAPARSLQGWRRIGRRFDRRNSRYLLATKIVKPFSVRLCEAIVNAAARVENSHQHQAEHRAMK
jgi:hypothetical protein